MTRHRRVCTRNRSLGLGSCWYWWEGCPETVARCDLRRQRATREGGPFRDHAMAMERIALDVLDAAA